MKICQQRKKALKEAMEKDASLLPVHFYQQLESEYIVIDDLDYFLSVSSGHEKELEKLLVEAAECGVGIVITVHAAKLKGYDTLSKWVKTAVHGLVLSPQGLLNIFPVKLQREYPVMGQGLLFHNGVYERVLIPECK